MKGKRMDARGETVVEVLAAVLIAALSVTLLFGAVMASSSLNQTARESDGELYLGLNNAQTQKDTTITNKSVTVTAGSNSVDIEVNFYGGGGVFSYAPKEP